MHWDLVVVGGILSAVCVLAGLIWKVVRYEQMDIASFAHHTSIGTVLACAAIIGVVSVIIGLILFVRGRRFG